MESLQSFNDLHWPPKWWSFQNIPSYTCGMFFPIFFGVENPNLSLDWSLEINGVIEVIERPPLTSKIVVILEHTFLHIWGVFSSVFLGGKYLNPGNWAPLARIGRWLTAVAWIKILGWGSNCLKTKETKCFFILNKNKAMGGQGDGKYLRGLLGGFYSSPEIFVTMRWLKVLISGFLNFFQWVELPTNWINF